MGQLKETSNTLSIGGVVREGHWRCCERGLKTFRPLRTHKWPRPQFRYLLNGNPPLHNFDRGWVVPKNPSFVVLLFNLNLFLYSCNSLLSSQPISSSQRAVFWGSPMLHHMSDIRCTNTPCHIFCHCQHPTGQLW
jgi:hypothetical protein